MAPIQTHRAHCGACGALMVLRVDNVGCSFVCDTCGAETPDRSSVAEADDDVVWVPVTVPATKALLRNGGNGENR